MPLGQGYSKQLKVEEPEQVRKRLKEKEALWPPPIAFSQFSMLADKKKTENTTPVDLTTTREFTIKVDADDDDSDSYRVKV
jgi:hypothetical protein